MTTTMTTIGYGDNNAAKHDSGYEKGNNMALICFLQVMAIFTFSLITDKLFSIQIDVKLQDVISENKTNATNFLHDLEQV